MKEPTGMSSCPAASAPSRCREPRRASRAFLAASLWMLACCGSGGGGGGADSGCDGSCTQQALDVDDVRTVLVQAVGEAERLGVAATISVVDRVGNVLAVFRMTGAADNTVISSARTPAVNTGLETLVVPTTFAAISKAGTAAYLSSQGNAFTTRTASQIVQEHFDPHERGRPAGPLFGVQFSQLVCGDLVTAFDPADPDDRTGPHRLPLGLSADAGAVPLYKDSSGPGALVGRAAVGGIGVEIGCGGLACDACTASPDSLAGGLLPPCTGMATCLGDRESLYTLDRDILDVDVSLEERIASAGAAGFGAPLDRRADRMFVDGKSLRFVDDEDFGVLSGADCEDLAGSFVALTSGTGAYTDVVSCASLRPGVALGSAASGVKAVADWRGTGLAAEVLVDGDGTERFAPRAGSALSEVEVETILAKALATADRLRAQIRRPLDTPARVTISVVDSDGSVLGLVRSPDAPVFGIDVSLQKARGAVLASSPDARATLEGAPGLTGSLVGPYVTAAVDFLTGEAKFDGEPVTENMVLTGAVAFADRSIGNLSRPFFPDGLEAHANGPFSRPFDEWSPFSTGLQLDLVLERLAGELCGGIDFEQCSPVARVRNGIQIFPGSVPVYRGSTLVGGVGVSGDGIDQDDAVAFLAVHEAGVELGTLGNAPKEMRADNLAVDGANLRYVNCPVRPFRDSDEQGICDGK